MPTIRRKGCRRNSSRVDVVVVDVGTPIRTRRLLARRQTRTVAATRLRLAGAADVATRRTGTSPRQPAAPIRASDVAVAAVADAGLALSLISRSRGKCIAVRLP